jgi:hypothetical protein
MQKIKKILEELLEDIELLELNQYKEAMEEHNLVYEYEILFGGIPSVDIETDKDYINKRCDNFTKDYFLGVENILNEELFALMTREEAINDLKKLETNEKTDFFFNYNSTKIKNKLLKQAIKLNDIIDKPFIKLRKLEEIQYKKLIDGDDFEALFSKSKNSQIAYRSRSRFPLPFLGGGKGKDVMYNKEECEKWFENHYSKK